MNMMKSLNVIVVIVLLSISTARCESKEITRDLDDGFSNYVIEDIQRGEDTEDTEASDDIVEEGMEGSGKTKPADDALCKRMIDLGFVFDSSDSIGPVNFRAIKAHALKILDPLDLFDCDRVGLVKFTDFANTEILFTSYNTKAAIIDAITEIQGPDHYRENEVDQSRVDYGLQMADILLFSKQLGSRNSSEKYLVVMTDGRQPKSNAVYRHKTEKNALHQLQKKGVTVLVLIIGYGLPATEQLNDIYKKHNIFSENHLDELISRIIPVNYSSNSVNSVKTSSVKKNETRNDI